MHGEVSAPSTNSWTDSDPGDVDETNNPLGQIPGEDGLISLPWIGLHYKNAPDGNCLP